MFWFAWFSESPSVLFMCNFPPRLYQVLFIFCLQKFDKYSYMWFLHIYFAWNSLILLDLCLSLSYSRMFISHYLNLFIYLLVVPCILWDPTSLTRDWTWVLSYQKVLSPNHWTHREFPKPLLKKKKSSIISALNLFDYWTIWYHSTLLEFPVLFFDYIFYWSAVHLQCYVNFCSTAKWYSYTRIYNVLNLCTLAWCSDPVSVRGRACVSCSRLWLSPCSPPSLSCSPASSTRSSSFPKERGFIFPFPLPGLQ